MADLEKASKWVTANITGLLAVMAGVILLGVTYKIILNIFLFIVGLMLVYFGLVKLKVSFVVDAVDRVIEKIKLSLK